MACGRRPRLNKDLTEESLPIECEIRERTLFKEEKREVQDGKF